MTRYYFDFHDGEGVLLDEEGRELRDLETAEVAAAHSLARMARAEFIDARQRTLAIHVRTLDGPLFQASLTFELKRIQ